MKVLHILYKLMPSGAEKMLADAAAEFEKNGVKGWILINDDEDGEYAPFLGAKGYTIVRIPWRRARLHLIDFWKLCRRERFDAVHIHVIRGYAGFTVAARLAGVKSVIKTFHGIFLARDHARRFAHSAKRLVARLAGAKMVAISQSVYENELRTFWNKCQLVWNFANESEFPLAASGVGLRMRKMLGIAEDSFVILSVGNCHSKSHAAIKNHSLIIQAIASLPEEIRKRIVYIHIGAEMDGCPERCLAEKFGVADAIKFLGSRDDVYDFISASNVYVMSSLREGLGVSTIEAAFSGREMILTCVQGLRDFGQVISEGIEYCELSPESMAGAIIKKLRNAKNGRDLSGNARIREDALNVFSMRSFVGRLVRLYGGADAE